MVEEGTRRCITAYGELRGIVHATSRCAVAHRRARAAPDVAGILDGADADGGRARPQTLIGDPRALRRTSARFAPRLDPHALIGSEGRHLGFFVPLTSLPSPDVRSTAGMA